MEPTLYILMRTDMASLNPGKAMAQAAHAANLFQTNSPARFQDWAEGRGFGTTIVLDVGGHADLTQLVEIAQFNGRCADIVLDPTYPVRDGAVTHLIPVETCGYIYTPCRKEYPVEYLKDLDLHP